MITDWHQREKNFAENLRTLREQKGVSQSEIARRLDREGWPGFHQTTISRVEKGERTLSIGEAAAVAEMLGSSLDRMMDPPEGVEQAALLDLAIKMSRDGRQNVIRHLQLLETFRDALVATLDGAREWRDSLPHGVEKSRATEMLERAEQELAISDAQSVLKQFKGENGKHPEAP
ncbi:helix-turn-helix transcriptional regulator [Microbacterium horticulturae]|uniref:Helix-turn-helix transcriptional regulator n=1 Tax=Microbacterium horticulturae TaxID=3028316 RepID=A0ABY8C1V0_9MICO|nr:helix-turn-helix transcriptional regulator [Microbacterium sp. KACC 23027]WEG10431.1 helix-turn-helix transcriptional regulator [Microbacterium sp. KACC 23027]